MRNRRFQDAHHAAQYLTSSVIRYKELPIFVSQVMPDKNGVSVMSFCDTTERGLTQDADIPYQTVNLTDPDVDMTPVPLGFVNFRRFGLYQAIRTFRAPIRAWKIGLTTSNLIVEGADGRRRDLLYSNELKATILGNFPSFAKARNAVVGKDKGQAAFSRRFSVSYEGLLFHLFFPDAIGKITSKGDPSLSKDFMYLGEALSEDLSK